MWNALKALLPKPPTPDERLWRLVFRGLESDAKLLASGLDAAGRSPAGSWATLRIECEIAALRAWAGCAAFSGGCQTDSEALIQTFETRFRAWLEQKRGQPLASYCAFSQATVSDTLRSLSEGWRLYDAIARSVDNVSSETLADFVALFWGRCVEGYTHQKIDAFLSRGTARIDQFIPRYVSFQIQLATAAAPKRPDKNSTVAHDQPVRDRARTPGTKAMPPPPLPKYLPGQIWAFKGSDAEPDATLTILRVDHIDQEGRIIHIAVSGLKLPHGGTAIGHMPFAEASIDRSVTTRLRDGGPVPDYSDGYEQWRSERGGFFTTTVAEGIDCIRQMIASRP